MSARLSFLLRFFSILAGGAADLPEVVPIAGQPLAATELTRDSQVPTRARAEFEFRLECWIDPAQFGFFGGDGPASLMATAKPPGRLAMKRCASSGRSPGRPANEPGREPGTHTKGPHPQSVF